ncbi:YdeI/OmpD-associated family protein [Sutcliffiella horikoshii]|uniref:YdeI/OmpD-associated family protein n=1 Tax=Sutcliffiella horikoshii TaxID=79883 RepID=UPI0038502BFF
MNAEKTIVDKLNLQKYEKRLFLQLPEGAGEFEGLDYDTSIKKEKYDLIFLFMFSMDDFNKHVQVINEKQLLSDNGYLYVAYPKKGNSVYPEYIERDSFYAALNLDEEKYLPNSTLKFSRMVSLNEVFTVVGLKSTPKKAKKNTSAKSQCVDDYIVHIEDIKSFLKNNEEVLAKYNDLTYGYQKDWARYVYSAKRAVTQEKRLHEMVAIIDEGHKSMDLYRRNKK